MAVGSDGSLGAWGGKKYEGLGSRDVLIFKIFRSFHDFEGNKAYPFIKIWAKEKNYDTNALMNQNI